MNSAIIPACVRYKLEPDAAIRDAVVGRVTSSIISFWSLVEVKSRAGIHGKAGSTPRKVSPEMIVPGFLDADPIVVFTVPALVLPVMMPRKLQALVHSFMKTRDCRKWNAKICHNSEGPREAQSESSHTIVSLG
jgi:hypothetical protein